MGATNPAHKVGDTAIKVEKCGRGHGHSFLVDNCLGLPVNRETSNALEGCITIVK
jgi:hypothetical protein